MVNFKKARERMVETQMAARGIRDERVLEAMLKVPRHQFVDEALTVNADEISLPSGRLFLPGTHGIARALFIHEPLDPVRDRHASTHVNILQSRSEEPAGAVLSTLAAHPAPPIGGRAYVLARRADL